MLKKRIEDFKLKLRAQEPKEFAVIVGVALLVVILTMWVAHRGDDGAAAPETELGTLVPRGFLIVPIHLANESSLSALVSREAVVDVFKPGQNSALIENLRVIKLSAGDGPAFGALVPEKIAGGLQTALSNPKLTAALRTLQAGQTRFHIQDRFKPLLVEVPIGGD